MGTSTAGQTRESGTGQPYADFTRAQKLTADVQHSIDNAFEYQPWDEAQTAAGTRVRQALANAAKKIVNSCPPSPTRTRALNMCFDARMLANAAITHRGRV